METAVEQKERGEDVEKESPPEGEDPLRLVETTSEEKLRQASIEEAFERIIPKRLEAVWEKVRSSMAGIEGAIQFDIAGDSGGSWHFLLSDKKIEVARGRHAAPSTTFALSAEDYYSLMRREQDPQTLFLTERISLQGDLGLAMRLGQVMQNVFAQGDL